MHLMILAEAASLAVALWVMSLISGHLSAMTALAWELLVNLPPSHALCSIQMCCCQCAAATIVQVHSFCCTATHFLKQQYALPAG
jgi:hypothetical protein